MNLKLFKLFLQAKSNTLTIDQLIERLAEIQNTSAGEHISPGTAMTAPTVFSCVRVLSQSVSSLPINVVLRRNDTRTRLPNHPLKRILQRTPNMYQTAPQYWSQCITNLLLWAKFAARKIYVNGALKQLVPIHPDAFTVEQENDGTLRFIVQYRDGRNETLTQDEVHCVTA